MNRNPMVKSWATVSAGCEIAFRAYWDDGNVDFTFGSGADSFELGFDTASLRHFLDLAAEALGQLEPARASS